MRKPKHYIYGLDGLRALSVIAVIFYHLNYPFAAGGYLGVTLFFVLSGYLITDLLCQEYEATATIDLKQFWLRRFRRLLPALYTVLLVVGVWITLFQRSFLTGLREDVFAALAYVSNWWYIAQDQSYFTKFEAPSVLQHLWSLAVEEQFYIVWPFVIWLGLKIFKQPIRLLVPMAMIMLTSLIAMAVLYVPGEDPSRLYFGTDTRLFSIVLGGMLAVVWPSRVFAERVVQQRVRNILDAVGTVALLVVLLGFVFFSEGSDFLYRGGMGVMSLLMLIVIGVVVIPNSRLGKLLSLRPLRWIGARSYGIYLWHFPIIILIGGGLGMPLPWYKVVLVFVLTFICTVLSWHFIETPVRYGGLSRAIAYYRTNYKTRVVRTQAVIILLILGVFTTGMISAKSQSVAAAELQAHLEQAALKQAKAQEKAEKLEREQEQEETAQQEEQAPASQSIVTAVGDSVMLAASDALQGSFPTTYVDAAVGRQVSDAVIVLDWMAEHERLGDIVVIALGSNGAFPDGEIERLITKLGNERQIFFVNTNVPRYWKDTVNTTLQQAQQNYTNVHVIDWDTAASQQANVFYEDGIHPNKEGAIYYAQVIKNGVEAVTGAIES
ncbi:hypothetical protein CH76_06905 [Lysinibacillus sp. BF-4]|uniref:acyltransferase family protein n=1 Tax=Lysinibacillus sp. BF-4 TaxID=1473546 RepID=UPI000508D374|nr:acyltransferase family protein [Lysinibacillus sp. BF-4]KFL43362.1 hypothetical protein CH76_06905 [Lysinibacillus sp. BF-4]